MIRNSCLAGVLIAVAAQALNGGLVLRHVPTESSLGPLARILDSLAPWFLALALVSSGALAALGARMAGGLLAAVALPGAGGSGARRG